MTKKHLIPTSHVPAPARSSMEWTQLGNVFKLFIGVLSDFLGFLGDLIGFIKNPG